MSAHSANESTTTLDLSDLDRWVGKRVIYHEFWNPCNDTDIRRWVQAMDYPNPIHWDEEFARKSRFGGIVAPQSFMVAMDYGNGSLEESCVGTVFVSTCSSWWSLFLSINKH